MEVQMGRKEDKITLSLRNAGKLRQVSVLQKKTCSAIVDEALDIHFAQARKRARGRSQEELEQLLEAVDIAEGLSAPGPETPMVKGNSVVQDALRDSQEKGGEDE
jgi:hypothetical protein